MSDQRELKNAVFNAGAPSGIDPRTPMASQASQLKNDFGFEIPAEVVPLPSRGLVYPVSSSLHGKDVIEIKAMTAKEEDILTSRALLKKGTVITELIRSCLIDRSINPLDLLSGDRNALMVAIRITGYGHTYDAELECSSCSEKFKWEFNLAELPIKQLEIEPTRQGANEFEFTLPGIKKVVKFKFLTGADEEEIARYAERTKKHNLGGESNVTTNLLFSITEVEGVTDRAKLANFVKSIPARDSMMLRSYIRESEPGIVMKQEATCGSCGYTEEVNMPLGASFLWPSS